MVKAERPFQVTSVASAPALEPYARAVSGPDTIQLGEDFPSRCAVLVDLDTRTVLAEKNADTVISPASMTKVLTVLVAAEHITEAELDDTFTMTIDITDYCYVNGCSVVGLILSNWFLRRIEDKDTGGSEVTGAKTGYVVESGNCAASCGETADGRRYICVTADAYSSWRAIYDHVALYKTYCSPADDTTEDGGAADPLVEPVAPTIKDTTEHESGASL